MKKFVFSFVLFTMVLCANAQTSVVKTNPLGLAFGNFNVTYEKVLNPSSSFLVKGEYMFQLLGVDVNLGGIGAGYRYYITHLNKTVPTGFYLMPEIAFAFGSIDDDNGTTYSANTFGIGAEIGYQWIWSSGFALDLAVGPMYTKINSDDLGATGDGGIIPTATLAIGYAF